MAPPIVADVGVPVECGGPRMGAGAWNSTDEQPDRAEAEQGVRTLQELYSRMERAREKSISTLQRRRARPYS